MRKFLLMMFAALSAFIFAGCAETPQQTAHKWGEAILSGDLAAADKYSSPETRQINEAIIKDFAENAEHRSRFEANWQKLTSAEVAFDGDLAFIIIDGKASLALVRGENGWLVHINVQKNTGNSDAGNDVEASAKAQAAADSLPDSE